MKKISETKSAELAAKVANDIHENIDCKETRVQLRECIHWWAIKECETNSRAIRTEGKLLMARLALDLIYPIAKGKKFSAEDRNAHLEVAKMVLDNAKKEPNEKTS